ncbi:diadenylate cyclase [Desulfobacula sp.]|uniref:diadenylate cyclase n=1 Tax=Desulfobacula sp. TaxID=2593537 RepID=UPI0026182814|nr:diadenylate cyclase [Desulfobacula sp.]
MVISELLTWRTILDILVIAAGMFFLYRTLIRLGTWKIVSGILVAAFFFIVASLLDLKGVEWIYKNVSQVAVLSLVVLFHPELRKFFERAASIRRANGGRYDEQFARLMAESAWRLSRNGIGAIVVIPGRERLEEWIKGGFPLNAHPSMPLILSIFDPNSPGHDGALIVQKGTFESFGVRLPISQSGKLSDDYGTRHQAGMGLSEKTDALILVVSEERRQVSIFHKGSMFPMQEENQIFERVLSYCRIPGFFQQSTPKKQIRKTFGLELLGSLAVAVSLWITIIAGQGERLEKVITVPVEYTATSEDVVMTGEKAKEARLHLAGTKSDLDAISASAMSVKINLAKAVIGKQTFLISEENIRLPRGVKLVDVDPSSVEIRISKLTEVELTLKPQLISAPPAGFKLVSVSTKPEKISVFIPSGTDNAAVKSLTTTPIYLDGIRENTTLFCKIISPPSIQPVDKRWPDIEVFLTIQPDSK